jgi:uncharacterized membrane protein YecN with MAPEG domain
MAGRSFGMMLTWGLLAVEGVLLILVAIARVQ